jgi:hypothetical protein
MKYSKKEVNFNRGFEIRLILTVQFSHSEVLRSWFRASSMIILNKNQPDAH